MNLKTKILLMLPIIGLIFWTCEKDDICDPITPVTSRLIVDFFNVDDNQPRNISNLAVVAENFADADTLRFNATNRIELPLNITTDSVDYTFILNYQNANPALVYTDQIQFNYTRTTEYVSRACGYKTLFLLNNEIDLPRPFILNSTTPLVPGNWIKNIIVENYNIDSENETHIEIYF